MCRLNIGEMMLCPVVDIWCWFCLFSFYYYVLSFVDSASYITSYKKLSYFSNEANKTILVEIKEVWNHSKPVPFARHKLKKRYVKKSLGEKCYKFSDCSTFALCMHGVCSCQYDHYVYVPPQQDSHPVCRQKAKYGYPCILTDDCKAYDLNSACLDKFCRCVNGTHYIGSRNLLTYDRRCYKILEREGDQCDIDEQCSRLADNHHKCRCAGRCDCTSVDHYGGCTICHENIKRTFFGGAAFIVLLLTSRCFVRMRHHSTSPQEHSNTASSTTRRNASQMLCSNTVPSVSVNNSNLRNNRRIASSLPNVFLIDFERRTLSGLPSSQTTHFLSHSSSTQQSSRRGNEDAPPSYDDIVESDQLVWNEPPPAYEEVALKYIAPRRP